MIIREVFDDQSRLLRLTADARPHGGQKSISRCDGCRCTKGKVKQNCAAMKAARDHLAHIGEKTRKSETYINPKTTPHFYCFKDVDIRQPQHCCLVHQYERYQEKMVGIGELLQHSKEEKILALKQIATISLGHSTVGGTRIGETKSCRKSGLDVPGQPQIKNIIFSLLLFNGQWFLKRCRQVYC